MAHNMGFGIEILSFGIQKITPSVIGVGFPNPSTQRIPDRDISGFMNEKNTRSRNINKIHPEATFAEYLRGTFHNDY